MRTRYHAPLMVALLALVVVGVGCELIQAKAAFKDGNKLYKAENYREAIKEYEEAVAFDPSFAEAHVYLASAHQSLYRPGRDDAENMTHLNMAIEHYETSLEVNTGETPSLEAVRVTALGALTGIYSDPPVENFEKALQYAEELVKEAVRIGRAVRKGAAAKFDRFAGDLLKPGRASSPAPARCGA